MTASPASVVQIVEPMGAAREAALRLALRHLPAPERQQAVETALAAGGSLASAAQAAGSAGGVLAAMRRESLVGAVWIQPQPGRAASVCPPQLVDGELEQTGVALLRAAAAQLTTHGVVLLQALLETDTGADFERFIAAGFQHVCDLLYLVSMARVFPTSPPAGEFEFVAVEPADEPRLARILERTYEGTLDCPKLNGVRSIEDVLAGYRANGVFAAEHWLICRRGGQDQGCLLLADHALGNQWELVYMGLVPEARGRGWGASLARHAQWLVQKAGRARLVLAVDATNGPAIAMYAAAGFLAWDRRTVLLRVLTRR